MSTKLTKKQKKAAAFRGKKVVGRNEPQDVPIMDDPAADDGFGQNLNADRLNLPGRTAAAAGMPAATPGKKRKREDDVTENNKPPSKKTKVLATQEEASVKEKEKKQSAAPKYILFVGNLGYKTTPEAIAEHFSACDPPPTIRRLTSRAKGSNAAQSEKSKGCAFLEFTKASGLQNALRLHHSELDGRKINVELSAGGGGKSEARLKKLKDKNAKLDRHRVDTSGNEKGDADEGELEHTQARTTKLRHSSTSGTKITPQHKPTWSVPKAGEASGRGGQKHRKQSRTDVKRQNGREGRPKNAWVMSGANSIPVG